MLKYVRKYAMFPHLLCSASLTEATPALNALWPELPSCACAAHICWEMSGLSVIKLLSVCP
jgi:hypothetical protein